MGWGKRLGKSEGMIKTGTLSREHRSSACKYHYLLEYSFNCRRWMPRDKRGSNGHKHPPTLAPLPGQRRNAKWSFSLRDQSSTLCSCFYCQAHLKPFYICMHLRVSSSAHTYTLIDHVRFLFPISEWEEFLPGNANAPTLLCHIHM